MGNILCNNKKMGERNPRKIRWKIVKKEKISPHQIVEEKFNFFRIINIWQLFTDRSLVKRTWKN